MRVRSGLKNTKLHRLSTYVSGTARRCTSLLISFAFLLAPALPAASLTAAQTFPKAEKEHSAFPSPAGGCQLNSARGKIQHVVTIIFDNMHFQRDPARDGSTLVPSDLEQMPPLLNFIKKNGVLDRAGSAYCRR